MRLCVRRFDEALCEKANKSSLLTMRKEVGEEFLPFSKWAEMEKKLLDNDTRRQMELDKQGATAARFQANIATEID